MCQNTGKGAYAMKKNELVKEGVEAPHIVSTRRLDHFFEVEVVYDPEANVWVAICDELGLATEGESLNAVIDRANLVIPELLADNGFPVRDAYYEVSYVFVQRQTVTFN
jgi:hypothetical protein